MSEKRICECCDREYEVVTTRQRFCTVECGLIGRRVKCLCRMCGKIFYASKKADCCSNNCRSRLSYDKNESKHLFHIRTFNCANCGKKVENLFCSIEQKYCSAKCSKRFLDKEWKIKRKRCLSKAEEEIEYNKVFAVKAGICGICGQAILEAPESNTLWAGTIDHIIPLSKGGQHNMDNCQLAHRICNSYKSDNIGLKIRWTELEQVPELDRYNYLLRQNTSQK